MPGAWLPLPGGDAFAAGTDEIADAATTQAVAHGLGVIPETVLLTSRANEAVWVSARDASNFTAERAGSIGALAFDWFATGEEAEPPPEPLGDPSIVVYDSFDRPAGTAIRRGETGHAWTAHAGNWGISSDRAYCADTTSGVFYGATVDAGIADGVVAVTVAATAAGNCGLVFRWTDSSNFWRWLCDDVNDKLHLFKNVAGTATLVTTVNAAGIAPGDELKVALSGSSIECYHNGTLKASTTDAHNVTATRHGLTNVVNGGSTATRFNDFGVSTGTMVVPRHAPFTDALFDQYDMASTSGLTFSTNSATKDAANPLFPSGVHSDTWDGDKLIPTVIKDGSTYRAFYKGSDGTDQWTCYATSTDGTTFTKPNLGLVSYGGNTDNNILLDAWFSAAVHDTVNDQWVIVAEDTNTNDGTSWGIRIYTSADPAGPYTLAKHIQPAFYAEGKELVQRPDGRWVAYYTRDHGTDRRSIGAYLSDTTDLTGTWTDFGTIAAFASTAGTRQYYALGVHRHNGVHYAFVEIYDSTAETIRIELYRSRNGLVYAQVDATFLPLGAAGAWDDALVLNGSALAGDGDDWHLYYSGATELHSAAYPRDSRIGRTSIGQGRFAQATGTGTITTEQIEVVTNAALNVNADASGGSLVIEVLDENGATLAGYDSADFDTITTDDHDHSPTWGGLPLPTGQVVQLVFTLTSATLYSYSID